jgi:hypothetical protein
MERRSEKVEKDKEKNNNKKFLAVLLLVGAFALVFGASVAYFSDVVTGGGAATVGTLDITTPGTITPVISYMTDDGEGTFIEKTDGTLNNINPGDIVSVTYTVSNAGNKSAWLRDYIKVVIGTNHNDEQKDASAFKIYPATATNTEIRSSSATALTTTAITNGFEYAPTATSILNGTGTAPETEIDGVTSHTAGYKLYFLPTADNSYQGVDLTFNVSTQAMQFRNNPTPTWSNVVTESFTIGQ